MKTIKLLLLRLFPNAFLKRLSTDNRRRAFFVGEYQQMLQRMWRGEFVGAKKAEIREGIRREYDKVNEDLAIAQQALEIKKDDPVAIEGLNKIIEGKKKDIAQLKEQIDSLDKEVLELNDLLLGYREGLSLLQQMIND